jgi:hypothetical protein
VPTPPDWPSPAEIVMVVGLPGLGSVVLPQPVRMYGCGKRKRVEMASHEKLLNDLGPILFTHARARKSPGSPTDLLCTSFGARRRVESPQQPPIRER